MLEQRRPDAMTVAINTSANGPRPIQPRLRELTGSGPTGFFMGDANGRGDERPVHRVVVDPFAIAVHPVTNREYAVFLDRTGHDPPNDWGTAPFDHFEAPVCGVSWFDAVTYAKWLGCETDRAYHLPTEVQREYAARGGREQWAYPWGNEPLPLSGPYERGLNGARVGGPMPIITDDHDRPDETAGANEFGLFHMADNVHEWCADYYDRDYYRSSPTYNPRGPEASDRRAARGGSWRHDIKYSRCAARSSLAPDKRFADFGFRLASSKDFEYVR